MLRFFFGKFLSESAPPASVLRISLDATSDNAQAPEIADCSANPQAKRRGCPQQCIAPDYIEIIAQRLTFDRDCGERPSRRSVATVAVTLAECLLRPSFDCKSRLVTAPALVRRQHIRPVPAALAKSDPSSWAMAPDDFL